LGAFLNDSVVYFVPYVILIRVSPIASLIVLAVTLVCQIYLLSSQGQTLGKKVVNIRIVKVNTCVNGGFATNVLLRMILNGILESIPFYGLIDILFIFRKDLRWIHDSIAGTHVVDSRSPESVL